MRAFNLFFGLGIPAPLQQEGFEGVMEPLKPLADTLLIMRGIDHVRADQSGINAHFDGSSAAFTATPPNGEARADTKAPIAPQFLSSISVCSIVILFDCRQFYWCTK